MGWRWCWSYRRFGCGGGDSGGLATWRRVSLMPLLLLTIVVSRLSSPPSSTEQLLPNSSKWNDSQIWPCVNVELYHPIPQNGSNVSLLLRTLYLYNWTLDFASDGRAQNFTPSMLEILQTAQDGFNRSLGRGIPSNRDKYPINPDNLEVAVMSGIRIQIDTLTSKLDPVADESYRIHIPHPSDSSWIDLHSVTVYGARHGLETIKQLLKFAWIEPTATGEPTAVFGIHNTPLYIEDGPAYAYRGLMIDTARHYLPLTLILQNLELMAAHKLNVLHWHVTDSQSWPYQSAAFPELSARGAYCEACVYTRSDVDAVVRQAAALGIRVIAEFDLPGHSQAIGQSHPELLSTNWRGEPSEPLDVTEPAVHNFVNRLYDEIAQVFPDDWIHIGGDEVDLACWENSTKVQDWMKAHNISSEVELWQYFELGIVTLVETNLQKRAIAWQDSFDSGVVLPQSTILDIWKEWTMQKSLYDATSAGYDVVFSACWYLDHLDEDWWSFYRCDPRGGVNSNLTDLQRSRILGGHASMWGERVDSSDFFERVWPRASAVAEVLWAGGIANTTTALGPVQRRLERFRCWLIQQFDIPASPISPGYCETMLVVSVSDTFEYKTLTV